MKIVGYTATGYLIEATTRELVQISGDERLDTHPEHWHHSKKQTLRAGTEVKIGSVWDHIQKVTSHAETRKRIAEQLRAAATVVETTMDVVDIPAEAEKPLYSVGDTVKVIRPDLHPETLDRDDPTSGEVKEILPDPRKRFVYIVEGIGSWFENQIELVKKA